MSKHTPHSAFAPAAETRGPDLAALHPEPQPEPATALTVTEPDDHTPEPYDPAEYRWVPVRRRPRYDGWTEEKQRRFIETLADTGLVNVAARAVGMSRPARSACRGRAAELIGARPMAPPSLAPGTRRATMPAG